MTVKLDPVTKKLLNDFFKSQPALNKPGVPAAKSGILLGDIMEAALNHPKPSLDAVSTKLLNDFQKSQIALQRPGVPAAKSGILLGDILNNALTGVGSFSVVVKSPAHGLASGAIVTVANATKVTMNGSKTVTVSDSGHFAFPMTSSPGASGTLDWSKSAIGVSYLVSGTGPYTITVASPLHGLASGAIVTVANGSDIGVNGPQTVHVIDGGHFSFSLVAAPLAGTLDWSIGATGVSFACQLMDSVVLCLLNRLQKTQPALQKPGVPAANSGIRLGDLILQAIS